MSAHRRLAILLGALAGMAALLVVMTIGWARGLAGWTAWSFIVAAIAWWRLVPGIFGKGQWYAAISVALLGPFVVLTWISWWLANRGSPTAAHQIQPGLWLGRWPGRRCPPGVERVVDLTAELARPRCARDREYHCLPTLDRTAPDIAGLRRLIDLLQTNPKPTLVHCAMGHGRSATLVAALLIREGMSVDAAIKRMTDVRPGVGLTDEQRTVAIAAAAL